jgi:hypothetical protein
MDAAARGLAPGGRLAPRRLRVWAALARAAGSAVEARAARAEVRHLGARLGLRVESLEAALATDLPYVSITASEAPAGPAALVWDLPIGGGAAPDPVALRLEADAPGPVGGVLLWFEAELDDGLTLGNAPGADGHWGRLLASFAEERGVRAHGAVQVALSASPGGAVDVRLA